MRDIVETYSPAGCEEFMRDVLIKSLREKFDSFETDNLGNLVAKSGDGKFCIECGMDSVGVMVVSKEECGVRFAPVGKFNVKDVPGRKVIFANGVSGEVCADSEDDEPPKKVDELYIRIDAAKVEIGDFGAFDVEFNEDEFSYTGYGLKDKIALLAVCKAVGEAKSVKNITVLFSAQKRLGGRGIRGYFGANGFDGVVLVDGCQENECVIVAKDERAVSSPELRRKLETIGYEKDVDISTVVSDESFYMEQVSVLCGDPCVAVGIPVLSNDGEPQRVNKSDFETAVRFIAAVIEREEK